MRAAIVENGVVTNIIVVSEGYEGAVPTGNLPVAIGDTFDGTDFWRDGVKVEINPIQSEELEAAIEAARVTE